MITLLIPTRNERETLPHSLQILRDFISGLPGPYEIVIADNGSTDGTSEYVRDISASDPRFRLISLPNPGPGRAFAAGVEAAQGESIITLDADLSSDLAFIQYAGELLKHSEMVVGSKTFGKQRRTLARVLASQSYILTTQYLFDLSISDFSMGAKAFRRSAILPALPYLDPWTGYIFELTLFLRRRDKKIIQIGVDCDDNRASRFNLLHEGFYRFKHLARSFRLLQDPKSWLNTA